MGEIRYDMRSTPRCAHGFVATRPTPRKTNAMGIIGIARYSSSLRLALHPTDRTPHAVQLPFLGSQARSCLEQYAIDI